MNNSCMNNDREKFEIDHVAFIVPNIKEAVAWYVKNTSAIVKYFYDDWALLDVYGNKLALSLPGVHPNHVALKINNIDEFPEDAIRDSEIKLHRDGSSYIYLADPYGNALEWVYYP